MDRRDGPGLNMLRGLSRRCVSCLALFGVACGGETSPDATIDLQDSQASVGAQLQSANLDPIRALLIQGPGDWPDSDSSIADIGQASAYDAQGNLILAFQYLNSGSFDGRVLTSAGERGTPLYGVAKVGPNGQTLWARQVPLRWPYYGAEALAVDSQGAILLSFDQGLIKLRPDGSTAWSRAVQPEPDKQFNLSAFAPLPGPSGDFIGVAPLSSWQTQDYQQQLMVIRYRGSDSAPLWTKILEQPDPSQGRVNPRDVAVDPFGQIYVIAHASGTIQLGNLSFQTEPRQEVSVLIGLTAQGQIRWAKKLGNGWSPHLSVASRDGHLAVAFWSKDENHAGAYVMSLDLSGQERWTRQLNNANDEQQLMDEAIAPFDVALGPQKEVVVTIPQLANTLGVSGGDPYRTLLLAKLDRVTGNLLAVRALKGAATANSINASNYDQRAGVAIDPSGKVTVTGAFREALHLGTGTPIPADGRGSTGYAATFTP